jgi:hypothetical protein
VTCRTASIPWCSCVEGYIDGALLWIYYILLLSAADCSRTILRYTLGDRRERIRMVPILRGRQRNMCRATITVSCPLPLSFCSIPSSCICSTVSTDWGKMEATVEGSGCGTVLSTPSFGRSIGRFLVVFSCHPFPPN